ncbi:MAG: hypothetical protein ACI9LX_000494 [Paraglaciecola sp.]
MLLIFKLYTALNDVLKTNITDSGGVITYDVKKIYVNNHKALYLDLGVKKQVREELGK